MDKKTKIIVVSCVSASAVGLIAILLLFLFAAPNAPFKSTGSSGAAAAGSSVSAQSAVASSAAPAESETAASASEGGADQQQGGQGGANAGGAAVEEPAPDELHIVTDDFEVQLPEYWRGKVDWTQSTNKHGYTRVDVFPKGRTDQTSYNTYKLRLVTFEAFPPSQPQVGGDIGNGRICSVEDKGKVVTTWQTNWSYLANEKQTGQGSGGKGYSESDLRMMVDLASCGTISYEECASKSNQIATPEYLTSVFENAVVVL